jgi:hypothetical protein
MIDWIFLLLLSIPIVLLVWLVTYLIKHKGEE